MLDIAVKFKALSDNNRLRIVASLMQYDELCACQITELLQITGATVSRHLSILTSAGIIESRKDGRWIFFRWKIGGIPSSVMAWMKEELLSSEEIKRDIDELDKITSCDPEVICRKQRGEDCCR